MSFIYQLLDRLLIELVYPQCLVCLAPSSRNLCDSCASFEKFEGRCQQCGKVTGAFSGFCSPCDSHPVLIDGIQSIYYLNDVATSILHRIKYGKEFYWISLFEPVIKLDPNLGALGKTWVVSVPMHWRRRISRGFNQSEILAKQLARKNGLHFQKGLLRKTVHTKPQSRLSNTERRENLKRAFVGRIKTSAPETVIIVDDVMTTGSTLKACSRALKKIGVKRVLGWTLFRTRLTKF